MARQQIPGSVGSRKAIAIRPQPAELQAIEALAQQWCCSLGEAAMRLVRSGLDRPHDAQPSDRVIVVKAHLCKGASRDEVIQICTAEWGITHRQVDELLAQARTLVDKSWDMEMAKAKAQAKAALLKVKAARQQALKNRTQALAVVQAAAPAP